MPYKTVGFNRDDLAALPPASKGKRDYYRHPRVPGLLLLVTDTGHKSFQLYVKHEGRPIRVTLGRFDETQPSSRDLDPDCNHREFLSNNPDLNIKRAERLTTLVKADLKSGINPTDLKRAKRSELTLGALFEEYVSRHLIPQKRDVDAARTYYELYVGQIPPAKPGKKKREKQAGSVNWHNRLITSIKTDDIQKLITSLATKGGSVNNANRVLTLVKAMYARAIDWGIFKGENPTDGVSKFKTKSRERFLQADELPRFFASLEMEPSKDIRDYVLLSLLTGARKRNILGMRWADLNLDRAVWTIPDELTKNGDPLTLPIVGDALQILKGRKPQKAATFVFPGTGKSGHLENSRKGWDRVLDRDELIQLATRIESGGGQFDYSISDPTDPSYAYLGILLKRARAKAKELEIDTIGARLTNLRPHDMRRTLGSWQASSGASLLTIGRTLGHKSQAATLIYSRLNLDPIRQSMETATKAILVAGNQAESATVSPIKTAKGRRKTS